MHLSISTTTQLHHDGDSEHLPKYQQSLWITTFAMQLPPSDFTGIPGRLGILHTNASLCS